MDALFHFVFPMIAALAARIKIKHPARTILLLASLTVLLDLDHFIGLERYLLHNIFIAFLIPLILLYLAFHFRLDRYKKGFLFLLLIFLSSHVLLDLFNWYPGTGIELEINKGGVALFYPFSATKYSIDFSIIIPLTNTSMNHMVEGYVVSSIGFGILIYFLAILIPCIFLEDIIILSERKHEKLRKAAREFLNKTLKD